MMQKLWKSTAIIGAIYILSMLGIIFYLGSNRMVVIAEAQELEAVKVTAENPKAAEMAEEYDSYQKVEVIALDKSDFDLAIPLADDVAPEQVLIENHYGMNQLQINLDGSDTAFYESHPVLGNLDIIEAVDAASTNKGTVLIVQLDTVYEFQSMFSNGDLQISLKSSSEIYDKSVILHAYEPEGLEIEEKDILYTILEETQAKLSDAGIKVYVTADEADALELENIVQLSKQTKADFYVCLTLAKKEDTSIFGSFCSFNPNYYMPALTNGQFADIVEQGMVTAISGKALGLNPTEDEILQYMQIPSVIVCPGYVSNQVEKQLLLQPSYQQKIAEGICNGIKQAYEVRQ